MMHERSNELEEPITRLYAYWVLSYAKSHSTYILYTEFYTVKNRNWQSGEEKGEGVKEYLGYSGIQLKFIIGVL